MPLSNNIKRLEYKGWIFKGENTTLTMLDMKSQVNASLRDIGKAFNVSHETVNLKFKDLRDNLPDLWEKIKSKQQFYQNFIKLWNDTTLEPADICQKLFISTGQYRKLEGKLIPRQERKYRLSVPLRKNNLCRSLFGYQFNPGEEFEKYVGRLFKKYLTEEEKQTMTDYYFDGADMPPESRFERHKAKEKLKIDNRNELLERNVICLNQEM